ncbi:PAS domain-containing protein [Hyphomicrobium sp.]|uniref:PAS domain-containing protein n=1 Tax=Hyphomicrobium sp. TaxID=82 RepID=UPI003F717A8A
MQHPATQALFAYWNEIRRDRMAPRRLEIEPARISDQLLDTFILERAGTSAFRFRLTGTRVTTRFGLDLRAQDFLGCWTDGDRALLEHHLAAITDLGRAGLFTGEARLVAPDMSPLPGVCAFEMLILPLAHTGESIDRLLGIIVPLEEDTLPAHVKFHGLRLAAAEAIWPDAELYKAQGFSDRQSPLHPRVRMARIVRQGRRQFRVYDGGLKDSGHGIVETR